MLFYVSTGYMHPILQKIIMTVDEPKKKIPQTPPQLSPPNKTFCGGCLCCKRTERKKVGTSSNLPPYHPKSPNMPRGASASLSREVELETTKLTKKNHIMEKKKGSSID